MVQFDLTRRVGDCSPAIGEMNRHAVFAVTVDFKVRRLSEDGATVLHRKLPGCEACGVLPASCAKMDARSEGTIGHGVSSDQRRDLM